MKVKRIACYLLSALCYLVAVVDLVEGQVVDIPDPVLREAVREALEKPEGDITKADMEGLTRLLISVSTFPTEEDQRLLQSFSGIESAVNLTELCFKNGTIALARPPANNRAISPTIDFSPLKYLRNLKILNLHSTQLSQMRLPDGLSNLTEINVSYNNLVSLTLPEGLDSLTRLLLYGNPIDSVEFPSGFELDAVEVLGGFDRANVTFYSMAVDIPDVRLRAAVAEALGKGEGDFITVAEMQSLTELSLPGRGAGDPLVRSLDGLQEAVNLISLDLSGFRWPGFPVVVPNILVEDFSAIGSLSQLELLDLGENNLTAVALPNDLGHLSGLDLGGNRLSHLILPVGLVKLSSLDVRQNELTRLDLPASMDLTHLKIEGFPKEEVRAYVEIPDPVLEDAVRRALDMSTGVIVLSDLEDVNSLKLMVRGFPSSLEGLQRATQLERLAIEPWHQEGDVKEGRSWQSGYPSQTVEASWFAPLADLNLLQALRIEGLHFIESIEFPNTLKSVTELSLRGLTAMTNLRLPRGMSHLTRLDLSDNRLTSETDFSFLEDVRGLRVLNLQGNRLTNLTLPGGFGRLPWTWVFLGSNPLTSLTLAPEASNVELNLGAVPLERLEAPAGVEIWSFAVNSVPFPFDEVSAHFFPTIRSFTRVDSGNQFTFHASAGNYVVQRSSDLREWFDIGTFKITEEQAAANEYTHTGSVAFTDEGAVELGASFYRVMEE